MVLTQRWRIETTAGTTILIETPMNVGPLQAIASCGLVMQQVLSVVPELPAASA
jgi:hypothetical protein